jgi:hypothetical protein
MLPIAISSRFIFLSCLMRNISVRLTQYADINSTQNEEALFLIKKSNPLFIAAFSENVNGILK